MSLGLDHLRLFANERHVGSALDEVIWDQPRDEARPGGPPGEREWRARRILSGR
jgi:hypothetical protein